MSTNVEPEKTIAILKAIDAYLMTQRAAAEAVGKHWLINDDKRKIEDERQDPLVAGIDAFMGSLDRSRYALVRIKGRPEVTVNLPDDED